MANDLRVMLMGIRESVHDLISRTGAYDRIEYMIDAKNAMILHGLIECPACSSDDFRLPDGHLSHNAENVLVTMICGACQMESGIVCLPDQYGMIVSEWVRRRMMMVRDLDTISEWASLDD